MKPIKKYIKSKLPPIELSVLRKGLKVMEEKMDEEIWMEDIECPHCDRCDSWDIKVDPYQIKKTEIVCDECGGKFNVVTNLSVSVVAI